MNKILSLVIGILAPMVVRQIDNFGHSVKWDEVKAKANERIAKIIPGDMFDTMVTDFLDKGIDAVAALLQDEVELNKVKDLCAAKQYLVAIEDLGKYLMEKLG